LALDRRAQPVYFGFLTKDMDMIELLGFYSPQIIAIDAPLSLPLGLYRLDEGCPCRPKSSRKYGQRDQELRRQGTLCYPTSRETFIKSLRSILFPVKFVSRYDHAPENYVTGDELSEG